ncbi:phosphatidylethanolamine-binding protein, partial [Mycena haematopus]
VSIRAVDNAFVAADIPTDLNIVFKPTALLEVSLPQTVGPPITLHAGIHVLRNDTAGPPIFHVVGNVGHGPFVISTVDPDALTPQDPTFLQPTPPAGSDAHRYIFLLFNQSPQFAHQTLVNSTTIVSNFDISQFARAVDLGNPIAGTFMLVAPEPTT